MSRYPLQILLKVLITSILLWSAAAEALTFNLKNRATPSISIQVGSGGGNIKEVSFTIPASQLGNGTPVPGSRRIRFQLDIRASGANPLTGFLTVDSLSNPLSNTDIASTSTIPFSQISWTARDGDIPSGTFMGTIDQPITNLQSSRRYMDFHTFSYANTLDIESGTYQGRVTYTWAVP